MRRCERLLRAPALQDHKKDRQNVDAATAAHVAQARLIRPYIVLLGL